MKEHTLEERSSYYTRAFPDYPPLQVANNKIYGVWIIGNYYKNSSDLYGAYPHSYLRRIMSLFPDAEGEEILHLFSGSVEKGDYTRFDINPASGAEVIGDAKLLRHYFPDGKFGLTLADPPYSNEDALHYGTPMISRNAVLQACVPIMKPRGFLVWLDQVFPMFDKTDLELVGTIAVIRSTNHRIRSAFIFRKLG